MPQIRTKTYFSVREACRHPDATMHDLSAFARALIRLGLVAIGTDGRVYLLRIDP